MQLLLPSSCAAACASLVQHPVAIFENQAAPARLLRAAALRLAATSFGRHCD